MTKGLMLRLFLVVGLLLGLIGPFISGIGPVGNSQWLRVVFSLLWIGIWVLFVRLAIEEALQKRKSRATAFGFFALLFTPLIPFHPPPFIWLILKVTAIGLVSFSILAEKRDQSETKMYEEHGHELVRIPKTLVWGVYLGPALGFFFLSLVFLPLLFGIEIGRHLALVGFGFLMSIVVLGTGIFSFFLNVSVVLMYKRRNLPPPAHYLFVPGCYYAVLLLYFFKIFSGPGVDIGDMLFREFLVLGGLIVIGVAFVVGVGVVVLSRRKS